MDEICSNNPFSNKSDDDEVFPPMPDEFGALLDANRVKRYMKYTLSPLMGMFGIEVMPDVDHLLTNLYKLDDAGRRDVVNMINALLINHTDPVRSENVKKIKGW